MVLSMKGYDFQRIQSSGTLINASIAGAKVVTPFPLQPGQVMQWDDSHRQNKLHIALVKWSTEREGLYRAGLMFL